MSSLHTPTRQNKKNKKNTHHPDRVKQAVLHHRALYAIPPTLVIPSEAATHGRPRRPHPCTATREEHVVVELVLALSWSTIAAYHPRRRRAFERDNDGRVVGRGKDLPAQPIGGGLPAKRHALRNHRVTYTSAPPLTPRTLSSCTHRDDSPCSSANQAYTTPGAPRGHRRMR